MTMTEDRTPRTFREVGLLISQLSEDIKQLEQKIDKIVSIVVVSMICPIVVAVVVAILIKNSQ